MATIKNVHQLEGLVLGEILDKMEAGASLHKRHSSIIFKVKHVDQENKVITIQVIQEKNFIGKYLDVPGLVSRTIEYFHDFFPGWKIQAHATPYKEPVVNDVTDAWLRQKMLDHSINLKKIVADTGIDNTNISAWINGKRPMSQIVRAMFYYYFLTYEVNRDFRGN